MHVLCSKPFCSLDIILLFYCHDRTSGQAGIASPVDHYKSYDHIYESCKNLAMLRASRKLGKARKASTTRITILSSHPHNIRKEYQW
ncbi:hypothetical protein [Methanosarcina sp.]|uniref:hypothetical protein n=1 Tax=Methanosarcina sp. TaxID=2213 RepID=UPI0029892EEF|nr:hypothetical protein [Methanosarcina sp.]MDW5550305.1 hypothetical protein [Methanosarcina sp.]MDW5554133.1 hypothetical protein [Methanosarcina sp.]MDW5560328.1 hypothetical protein [Methanosarcina sp.]